MQSLIVALEVNVSAMHCLQGKQKPQSKALSMITQEGFQIMLLLCQQMLYGHTIRVFQKSYQKLVELQATLVFCALHKFLSFLLRTWFSLR